MWIALRHGAHFTLRRKEYASIITRLNEGNVILRTLVEQNQVLAPGRRSQSHARLARVIRRLSEGLYSALKSVMTCGCSPSHSVGLQMEPRNQVVHPGEEDTTARTLDFSIMVGTSLQRDFELWDRICIRPSKTDTATPRAISPSRPAGVLKSRPRVRWALSESTTPLEMSSLTSMAGSQNRSHSLSQGYNRQPSAIKNLCQTIQKGKGAATTDCYGYISHASCKFKLNLHHIPCASRDSCVVTLRAVLAGQACDLEQFTYIERLKVALALSHSVTHLHQTPWISEILTSETITFFGERRGSDLGSYLFSLDCPFLEKASVTCNSSAERCQQSSPWFRPIILSLGLLLIQIITGGYIDDLAVTKDMTEEGLLAMKAQAFRTMAFVLQKGGPGYWAAIEWCLTNAYSIAGLENEEFGHNFQESVIARLENDLSLQGLSVST